MRFYSNLQASRWTISEIPLAMNLFGTRDRTNHALGVNRPEEIGENGVDEA